MLLFCFVGLKRSKNLRAGQIRGGTKMITQFLCVVISDNCIVLF